VIILELPKISPKKLQMVITFDIKVGWRRVNNESFSKQGNESRGQNSKNPPFIIIIII